jgi:hypothetical protein
MEFRKFVTGFEYFPRQGSGNMKSSNSFHKFHMPYALVQDPLFMLKEKFRDIGSPGKMAKKMHSLDLHEYDEKNLSSCHSEILH